VTRAGRPTIAGLLTEMRTENDLKQLCDEDRQFLLNIIK
jgi:hypothetical protein